MPEPKEPVPRPEMDDEYVLPELPVHDQETQPSKHFTWFIWSASLAESPLHSMAEPSDTEGALALSQVPPTIRQGHPGWPKNHHQGKRKKFTR